MGRSGKGKNKAALAVSRKNPRVQKFSRQKWQQRFEKWRWVDSKYVRPLMGSVHGFVLHVAYAWATVTFDGAVESAS